MVRERKVKKMIGRKKAVIKDKVELEKIIDYHLKNDLSLSLIENNYKLTYPQREFLLQKSMAYSRQQDALAEEYDTTDISDDYLETPHLIDEEYPLSPSEQIDLFRRLDEIDKEKIVKGIVSTVDELSKTLTALRRIKKKYGNDMQLCDLYSRKYPEENLKDILAREGLKEKRAGIICEVYDTYKELITKEKELREKHRKLLEKREELLNDNVEYSRIINTLVTTNAKLANWVLRVFFRNIPLPKEDAVAAALEGLGAAINRFDYTLGYNFSTFATKIICTTIERNFKGLMGITWPKYCMKNNIAYWREELLNYDKTRVLPFTPEELADSGLVKYTAKQIADMDDSVDAIYNFSDVYLEPDDSNVKSKDIMPCEQEDYDYLDAWDDLEGVPVDNEADEQQILLPFLRDKLEEVLAELSEREQKILRLRYGMEGEEGKTLEEIGKVFFVSRDRIRQIEAQALRRLRYPSRREKLLPYADDFDVCKTILPPAIAKDYIKAFMRLYDLRKTNLPYHAKAFFISTRNVEWDEREARNLDLLMEAFITNISLGEKESYPLLEVLDVFVKNFGSEYSYKYPYRDIYDALKKRVKDEENELSGYDRAALLEDSSNLIQLALRHIC